MRVRIEPVRGVSWMLVLAALGCTTDEATLVVQLRTDIAPGVEFDVVTVRVASEVDPGAERSEHTRVALNAPVSTGVRVAELGGLTPGYHRVRVELFFGEVWVAGTEISSRVRGVTVETVRIERDCRGIRCPGEGDPSSATRCENGQCVDPRCGGEGVPVCVPPECSSAVSCPSAPPCAIPTCEPDGVCFYVLDHDRCPPGLVCHAELGCVDVNETDGGPSTPDGGPRVLDGGPIVRDGATCGFTDCRGACVDTSSDVANCGGCGIACGLGESCAGGLCQCGTDAAVGEVCTADLVCCWPDCVDVATDESHCSGCGVACAPPHAVGSCVAGTCQIASCMADYDDCNGMPSDGCEIYVWAYECYLCGIICPAPHVAVFACSGMGFGCLIGSCEPGWSHCDTDLINGCETVGPCP